MGRRDSREGSVNEAGSGRKVQWLCCGEYANTCFDDRLLAPGRCVERPRRHTFQVGISVCLVPSTQETVQGDGNPVAGYSRVIPAVTQLCRNLIDSPLPLQFSSGLDNDFKGIMRGAGLSGYLMSQRFLLSTLLFSQWSPSATFQSAVGYLETNGMGMVEV